MSSNRLLILLLSVLIGACSGDRNADSPEGSPDVSLHGVYAGTFPCGNCPGIHATLWLRPDGRFFFRQEYPGDNENEASNAYNLGRWRWVARDDSIVLEGAGPRRTFVGLDRDTLVMRTESDLEHRLSRDPASPEFSAIIRMTGMMRMHGDGASFTECLTGLVAPVNKGGDFARYRHQYRSAGKHDEPAYVELEGRFSWSDGGAPASMTIERFVTVKAAGACE